MSKIKTYYKFEEGNLSIAFDKILLITTEITDPDELPEQFQTEEAVYNLTIKQQNSSSLTRVIVVESTYKDFEKSYYDYLDHKLNNSAIDNEATANLLKNTQEFFNNLEAKVDLTLDKVTEKSETQLVKARKEIEEVINKANLINEDTSTSLKSLNKLQTAIENFVLEDEEVETITGDLMQNEKNNNEEEEIKEE